MLRGRLKDAIVIVVRVEEEVDGFYWCQYQDRTGGHLVLREVLLNAEQLEQSQEGGTHA